MHKNFSNVSVLIHKMIELVDIPNQIPTKRFKTDKEKVQPATLELPLKFLNSLNKETIRRSQENSGEFWVFLLKSPTGQTISIPVGRGHSSGVSLHPNRAVNQLKPHIQKGYQVIADYHNHPNQSVSVYEKVKLPEIFATSPSIADLQCDENSVRGRIILDLHQKPYPRIIAAYSQERQEVMLNTFNILREPTDIETKEITFDEPNFVDEPDELEIQLLANKYVNPSKLDKLGIVVPMVIKGVNDDGSVVEIQNDLTQALSEFK